MHQVAVPRPRVRRASGTTTDVVIGDEAGVLTVGHGQDGAPCWMQLRVGAHGSVVSGLTDALATAVTVGLQHGVPSAALADALHRIDVGRPSEEHANLLVETFTSVSPAGLAEMAGR